MFLSLRMLQGGQGYTQCDVKLFRKGLPSLPTHLTGDCARMPSVNKAMPRLYSSEQTRKEACKGRSLGTVIQGVIHVPGLCWVLRFTPFISFIPQPPREESPCTMQQLGNRGVHSHVGRAAEPWDLGVHPLAACSPWLSSWHSQHWHRGPLSRGPAWNWKRLSTK